MNLETFGALVPLIAVPVWFIVDRLEQLRIEFKRFNDHEVAKESERQNRRELAKEALKLAVRDLSDPQYEAMDLAFGTGHGYRRAKRIVKARTFEEIDRIVSGDDIPTELDRMQFWQAVADRDREGKLFADPIPKYQRVEPSSTDREASRKQGDAEPSSPE